MDFKERLARMEERRGQTIEQTLAQRRSELGINEDILAVAEVLGSTPDNQIEEIVDLIGGLEHYRPYETSADQPLFGIGLEGMSDQLMRIFDRIIAFLKRWIKALADADFKLSLHTAVHSLNLDNLKTDIRTRASKPKSGVTFPVYSRIQNLSVNYRPINNPVQLMNSLTILSAVVSMYFDKHSEQVLKSVRLVTDAVVAGRSAEQVAAIVQKSSPMNVALMTVFRQQDQHIQSAHLMGNHRFIITDNNAGSTDVAEQVVGVRMSVEPSQITPVETPPQINFQYFDVNMADALLEKCRGILNVLADSNTSGKRYSRKQAMTALLHSVEKVNDELQRNGVRDEDDARRLVAVLETYVSWIADPYTSFYAYVLRNVRATMNVCEGNMG